jgi:hypothetical protein
MLARKDAAPKTYVSYDGNAAHRSWVEAFVARLREEEGIDAFIDKWLIEPGDQKPEHIEKAIRDHDFVVLICTPEYARLFNERQGEVGYAAALITGRLLRLDSHKKYVPVLRSGLREEAVPGFLSSAGVIDLRGDKWQNSAGYGQLVSRLTEQIGILPSRPDDERQRKYWNDLSWADLCARSAHHLRFVRASLLARIRILPDTLEPEDPIDSGLNRPWGVFHTQKTWKKDCLERIAVLRLTLGSLSYLKQASALVDALEVFDRRLRPHQSYATLRAAFAPKLTMPLLSLWQALRTAALREAGGGTAQTRHTVDQIRRGIGQLVTLGRDTPCRKCFLVMGGVGAGKSHFLASVLAPFEDLDAAHALGWLPIWVDRPTSGVPFADHLLAAIRTTTRVEWPSLDTCWDFVAEVLPDAKIVFVFDDLHKRFDVDAGLRQALPDAIEQMSRVDNVHWLLCLNDRAYASIAPLTERIWAAYSDENRNWFYGQQRGHDSRPATPRSGGWYRLDDIVEANEVGLEIVRQSAALLDDVQLFTPPNPEPDCDIPDAPLETTSEEDLLRSISGPAAHEYDATTRRALSNPLVASVFVTSRVQLGKSLDVAENVRFVPFINGLRSLLVERSLSEAGSSVENALVIEQAIDYVARAFAEAGDAELRVEDLRTRIAGLAQGESMLTQPTTLSAALQTLERAHLLDRIERSSPSSITRTAWNTLRFDLFWELHLADQQLRSVRGQWLNPDQAAQEIDEWLDQFKAVRLRNGVAQFLLLLSDSEADPFAEMLWTRALRAQGLPLHSALFAATHATTRRQARVARALRQATVAPKTADDLIALVHAARRTRGRDASAAGGDPSPALRGSRRIRPGRLRRLRAFLRDRTVAGCRWRNERHPLARGLRAARGGRRPRTALR